MDIKNQVLSQVPRSVDDGAIKTLQAKVSALLAARELTDQRLQVNQILAELNLTALDFAAAMLYLHTEQVNTGLSPSAKQQKKQPAVLLTSVPFNPTVKWVRYSVNLGSEDELSLAELKKVIVDESGVDVRNIVNVKVFDSFTLLDLPDEMPQEIFYHLKSVEINGKKLDIRRVKARKKHSNRRRRQHRPLAVAKALRQ